MKYNATFLYAYLTLRLKQSIKNLNSRAYALFSRFYKMTRRSSLKAFFLRYGVATLLHYLCRAECILHAVSYASHKSFPFARRPGQANVVILMLTTIDHSSRIKQFYLLCSSARAQVIINQYANKDKCWRRKIRVHDLFVESLRF